MGKKDIKNDFNLTSIFFSIVFCKVVVLQREYRESYYIFLIFTGSVASDGLSTAVVTPLFTASIKVTYKLLSQGWQETSIQDKKFVSRERDRLH